ncbi:MAG: FAD-binding protein [Paludibacteraceae bacterium]|nr:FAD-binding protein [Paludibacteraceae bacterium]
MEILTDSLHKIAYATDASVYREIPYGVTYPMNEEDLSSLIGEARRLGTSIIARAGGTSIAGQVVGKGIVADVSRHMHRILEINDEKRYAWVEPGVVRDELNIACKPYGLFFSPETSTSNRCCIGGMAGNNSCGMHSLIYGSTRPHVLEADGILSDGSKAHFAEYTIAELEERFGQEFWDKNETVSGLEEKIYAQLIRWALDEDTRTLIADTYPDKELTRRSCGYAIDEVIEGLCNASKPLRERTINLCRLIAGSEGTLALLSRIKVSLDPLPPKEVMVVCAHCTSLDAAFEANLIALAHHPTAVELMDGEIIELSRQNADFRLQHIDFVKGNPPALLIAELRSETREAMDRQAEKMENALSAGGLVTCCTRVYGNEVAKVWNLRKAGLGILNSMSGDAKPTGVIEDTAVSAKRLPAYMRDFRAMLERLGASCVFYGHISTGELHLRPILNLKTEEGKRLFRQIAHETTLLVRKHRGTISGEHGDGRLRGEFIPLQYGERTYELMRAVKRCWDPDTILNPHKIVDTPRMDACLRVDKSLPGNELLCRVEQCNGAGDCRKSAVTGGTMCPAYKVSGDELQSTRARANVLREWLQTNRFARRAETASLKEQGLISESELKEVLSSCLACKACKRECPSGVDMTRLRAEVLQKLYDREGTPLRTWMVAHNGDIQRLGALMPSVYNRFASNRWTSAVLKKIVGFAPERSIPEVKVFRDREIMGLQDYEAAQRQVYLFLDEFTRYQEPELAETFVRLMNRLGYEVIIPRHTESGRAAISKGCLHSARKYAQKNIRLLKDLISNETPLVGTEPSCILSFRDEYPDIVGDAHREAATRLAQNCMLFDEFMMREVASGRITAELFSDMRAEIWLHGHCHQKALVGVEKTAALLALPKNAIVHVIPSGCCGMAGSFGYEKAHYRTSIAIGEMILFPAVREAVQRNSVERPVFIAAPGISCRTQIKDGTGIRALHPIEILYRMLPSTDRSNTETE